MSAEVQTQVRTGGRVGRHAGKLVLIATAKFAFVHQQRRRRLFARHRSRRTVTMNLPGYLLEGGSDVSAATAAIQRLLQQTGLYNIMLLIQYKIIYCKTDDSSFNVSTHNYYVIIVSHSSRRYNIDQ